MGDDEKLAMKMLAQIRKRDDAYLRRRAQVAYMEAQVVDRDRSLRGKARRKARKAREKGDR